MRDDENADEDKDQLRHEMSESMEATPLRVAGNGSGDETAGSAVNRPRLISITLW